MDARLLGMELRAGRRSALARVRRALDAAGSVRGAAARLGISASTLQDWVLRDGEREIPSVSALVEELGLRAQDGRGRKSA